MENETIELIKTIAAFGGLLLGLVNLSILIHKDYLRRAKLSASVKNAEVKCIREGVYDIQIDIELASKGGTVYLKDMEFRVNHGVFDPIKEINMRQVYKYIGYPGYSTLNNKPDEFEPITKKLFENSNRVANTSLNDKEHKIISIIDRIHTNRAMDGYWEWPLKDWKLIIDTSSGTVSAPFKFSINQNNITSFFTDR